jgi:hypothetical protein
MWDLWWTKWCWGGWLAFHLRFPYRPFFHECLWRALRHVHTMRTKKKQHECLNSTDSSFAVRWLVYSETNVRIRPSQALSPPLRTQLKRPVGLHVCEVPAPDVFVSSWCSAHPKRGKAIPVTGRGGPQECETSRLPHCLDNRLTDGDKVVSFKHRPPFNPMKISNTHFWSTPGS